jgi:hypothetical protein
MNAFKQLEDKAKGEIQKEEGWVKRNRVQLLIGLGAVLAVVLIWGALGHHG